MILSSFVLGYPFGELLYINLCLKFRPKKDLANQESKLRFIFFQGHIVQSVCNMEYIKFSCSRAARRIQLAKYLYTTGMSSHPSGGVCHLESESVFIFKYASKLFGLK